MMQIHSLANKGGLLTHQGLLLYILDRNSELPYAWTQYTLCLIPNFGLLFHTWAEAFIVSENSRIQTFSHQYDIQGKFQV